MLGRSYSSVSNRAHGKGLVKSDSYRENYLMELGTIMNKNGYAYRFPVGHVPANKGKAMPAEVYEKAKRTMFKPGNKPANTYDGVGHISTRKDKKGNTYKYIKLADSKWVPLHRKLWTDANGEVAKGMIVVFIDRNTMNCVLENLMLISRKENRIRNAGHSTLKDTYVAGLMARDGRRVVPELAAELVKIPELIELKRNNLKLNRYVKEQRRSGGAH
ncbi:MAG: HNH endonuclease signature motif containing protein [Leadbetterella sp.]|nr:HNH endonuclease signature motif containing protein [Leadbetterella sp.]